MFIHSMYQKVGLKIGGYYLYVLILLGLITVFCIGMSIKRKMEFQQMTGFIISMFLGMNVGLTAGITFTMVYQENLFLATMCGMVFGLLAGSLIGSCFGFLASLEGVMAGVMGGMMGAMLGEMILVDQAIVLINLFLLLSVCTVLLLIILSTPTHAIVTNKRWILKPFLTSVMIGSIVFSGNLFDLEKVESHTTHQNHMKKTDAETNTEVQNVMIEALGMEYTPKEVFVVKNVPILLSLKNSDQVEHDILIKTSSSKMVNKSSQQHDVETNIIQLYAEPQTTSEITFTVSESGTYTFYCTIPGHRESGMVGLLVVE